MNGESGALARIESCSASEIWAEDQETGTRLVDVERALPTIERHTATGTPSARLLRLVRADGAIGLQVWVDVPRQPGLELSDDAVVTEVRRALEAIVAVAVERVRRWGDDRAERLRDELGGLVGRWVDDAFSADDAHVGWQEKCVPSCDADVLVGSLANPCAVAAASTQRWQRDGRWAQSKALRIAVGPDRYGLLVQVKDEPRGKGFVALPNEPFQTRFAGAVHALGRAVVELEEQVVALDDRVSEALTAQSAARIEPLLEERTRLMRQRLRLERRRRAFIAASDELSESWRGTGFELDPQERETLSALAVPLEGMRGQLVELPQLLIAVDSWRQTRRAVDQARRTELLSSAAAALVLPTLVAGVLGANVLPWEAKAGPEALIGMLVLMVACALGAVWLLRRLVFADPGREDAAARKRDDGSGHGGAAIALARAWHHRATPWAILALAVAGCTGIALGTTTEDPAEAGAEPPAAVSR